MSKRNFSVGYLILKFRTESLKIGIVEEVLKYMLKNVNDL